MPGLKERAKTLVELIDSAGFLWADRPLALDDKAEALLTAEARALIRPFFPSSRRSSRGVPPAPKRRCGLLPSAPASNWARWRSRCAPP